MPTIFLSYARDDDEPFVKRLYEDLTGAGFTVWWDRVSMPSRRLTFHQEIKDAIRQGADKVIFVVGPRAAVSDYVREEWQFALELDKPVIPILRTGDYAHVPGNLSLLHCDDFRNDSEYSAHLDKLIKNLERPEPPLGALFAVPGLPKHFLGRPELLRRIKDALLVDLQKPVVITGSASRVGVHGMGGIGKSVLAAALARDREVRRSYPDGIMWVAVGQEPALVKLQRDVGWHLGSQQPFETIEQGQGVLRPLLRDKAVLLILDDLWHAKDVEAFDVLGPRCRMLVTTRDVGILHSMEGEAYPIALFTQTEALQLLGASVGASPTILPREATEIVQECGCLPLAVALCGGMVLKRGGEWSAILDRLRRADLEKIGDREAINEQHRSLWRAMQASVDVLPPDEQRRFAELAVFETDETVPEAAVSTLWAHTGRLDAANSVDLLINLAERSLIRLEQMREPSSDIVHRRVSLHDLLHDFATRLAGQPRSLHQQLVLAYQSRCAGKWATGPSDGYFFEHVAHHLLKAGRFDDLYLIARDGAFVAAQRNARARDPELPLRTVRFAIQAADETDDAPRIAEFVLAHTNRLRGITGITHESPLDALRKGSLTRACDLADLYDLERGVLWYLLLAWQAQEMGHQDGCTQILGRLQQQPLPRLSGRETRFVVPLLSYLLREGREDVLVITRRLIDDEEELCKLLSEQRCFPVALRVSAGIGDDRKRMMVLNAIAGGQAEAGEIDAALETAAAIVDDDEIRDRALSRIAVAQADVGRFGAALATMDRVDDNWHRRVAYTAIAVAQARAGEPHAAVASFQSAQAAALTTPAALSPRFRAKALCQIYVARAKSGDPRAGAKALTLEATKISTMPEGAYDRDDTLADIAIAQAEAELITGALETVEAIRDVDCRVPALISIAGAQARGGQQEAAGKTLTRAVGLIGGMHPQLRALTLADVAMCQALAGDREGARRTFHAARTAAGSRASLAGIGEMQVRAGELSDALETAQSLEDVTGHHYYLLVKAIAEVLTRAGQPADAFEAVRSITSDWYRGYASEAIAIIQAQTGDFDAALRSARGIEHPFPRASALEEIATVQARAGDAQGAAITYAESLGAVYRMERAQLVCETLEKIAEAQAHGGHPTAAATTFAAARKAIERLVNDETRDWCLKWLAAAQARSGDLSGALATSRKCPTSGDWAQWNSIREHARVADLESLRTSWAVALAAVRSLPNEADTSHDLALEEIGLGHARVGSFSMALATAREIERPSYRSKVFREIAIAQERGGNHEAARELFFTASSTAYWDHNLIDIAIAQAESGFIADALATAQRIGLSGPKERALREIAIASAQGRGCEDTVRTLTEIHESAIQSASDRERQSALHQHALALARVDRFDAARDTALGIEDTYWRAKALTEVGVAQSQSEGREAAAPLFALAVESAAQVTEGNHPSSLLKDVALAQARAGDVTSASGTFEKAFAMVGMASSQDRLEELAIGQVQAGFDNQAVCTATAIAGNREQRLPRIAAALVAAGDRASFKQLVLPCAYHEEAAYKLCALLARAYPEQAEAVAEVVRISELT